jgi:hypothetical protein
MLDSSFISIFGRDVILKTFTNILTMCSEKLGDWEEAIIVIII